MWMWEDGLTSAVPQPYRGLAAFELFLSRHTCDVFHDHVLLQRAPLHCTTDVPAHLTVTAP